MYVCMYVCIYMCIYICVYVYIYILTKAIGGVLWYLLIVYYRPSRSPRVYGVLLQRLFRGFEVWGLETSGYSSLGLRKDVLVLVVSIIYRKIL